MIGQRIQAENDNCRRKSKFAESVWCSAGRRLGLAFCGAGQVLGLDGHTNEEPIRPPKQTEKELEDVEFECKPCGEGIGWEDGEEEEGREVKGQKIIQGPSKEEYEAHMRTHIPYRKWCPFCVKSKRVAEGHRIDKKQLKREKPLVSLDYMKQTGIIHREKKGSEIVNESGSMRTIVMPEGESNTVAAIVVPAKRVDVPSTQSAKRLMPQE